MLTTGDISTGNNDTGDHILPLSLTTVHSLLPKSLTRVNTEQLVAGIADTSNKHIVANISAKFLKILNGSNRIPSRARGKLNHEENLE